MVQGELRARAIAVRIVKAAVLSSANQFPPAVEVQSSLLGW